VVEAPTPPQSVDELMDRAISLAGRTLAELAQTLGYRLPRSLSGNKGFVGQLAELALGASAGIDPEPDFPALGVELKTLPIREDGRPLEATYVCQARMTGIESTALADSYVMAKLRRVLFLPVLQAETLAERRFAMPLLWSPDEGELAMLRDDFAMLQARVRMGEADDITTRDGVALHLRPKAMSSLDRTGGISDEGWIVPVRPRAWYLRPSFTEAVVRKHFGM
jgi:DNA mismatch repair protein MutH